MTHTLNKFDVTSRQHVTFDILKGEPTRGELPEASTFILLATLFPDQFRAGGKLCVGWKLNVDTITAAKKQGWVYIIVVDDIIYSIGMTADSLYNRLQSYHTGHYPMGSIRNQRAMHTLGDMLTEGHVIKMYGLPIGAGTYTNIFTKEPVVAPGLGAKETEKYVRNQYIQKFGRLPLGDLTHIALDRYLRWMKFQMPSVSFTLNDLAEQNKADIEEVKGMEKLGLIVRSGQKQGKSPLFQKGTLISIADALTND